MVQVEQAPEVQTDLGKFLESLSPGLKSKILNNLHKRVFAQRPEFREADANELNFIAHNLKTLLVLPKDIVIQQGTSGDEMYFIIAGKV